MIKGPNFEIIVLILTNSEDKDEMPHCAAFHQGLHCLSKHPLIKG